MSYSAISRYTRTYFVIRQKNAKFIYNFSEMGVYLIEVENYERATRFATIEKAATATSEWSEITGDSNITNTTEIVKVTSVCKDLSMHNQRRSRVGRAPLRHYAELNHQ